MSMNYDTNITPMAAWEETEWDVTVGQSTYFHANSTITIGAAEGLGLPVRISNADSTLQLERLGTYNGNGTLTWEGETQHEFQASTGQWIPEGTSTMFVLWMAIFEGTENHLTGLAVVEDPEDVAVIAAVEGGVDPR